MALAAGAPARAQSVARQWNEELMAAIRIDFPAPTVHARNLFHTSIAMYDAWAAYDSVAVGCLHNETAAAADVDAARDEAVSYAAYRVLSARYALAVDPVTTQAALDARMLALGYPIGATTTAGGTPAAVGNRCAAAVLAAGLLDGANETDNYADTTGYMPVNEPMILLNNGTGPLADLNRWQPLAFEIRITQNGIEADKIQTFVSPHWGYVAPFVLDGPWSNGVYAKFDPGTPPLLGGPGDAEFKQNIAKVIWHSSILSPENGEMIDISPRARGNNPVGTNDGTGYPVNPVTSAPYAPNLVKHGDYGRVIAEFWADGPQSETPPGHWNVLANDIGDDIEDDPLLEKRLGGPAGPLLDELEWDVKLYLALNGAVHDAAVAAWGLKSLYDYVRPITSIRHMGGLGQSSEPGGPSYDPNGLPLVPGLIEVVTEESSAEGERHELLAWAVGRVVIYAWPGEPDDPETEFGGSEWILAESWLPYQRDTFVTPAFAGYLSGHSTFSRAGAEVLAGFTGSPFFPGGMGTYLIPAGGLEFELGPSEPVELQWATYFDAADEAGISRLYGGIHVPQDDFPGRILGSRIGKASLSRALAFFDGSVLDDFECTITRLPDGRIALAWPCLGDFSYKVQAAGEDLAFSDVTGFQTYAGFVGGFTEPAPVTGPRFYQVIREAPGS